MTENIRRISKSHNFKIDFAFSTLARFSEAMHSEKDTEKFLQPFSVKLYIEIYAL